MQGGGAYEGDDVLLLSDQVVVEGQVGLVFPVFSYFDVNCQPLLRIHLRLVSFVQILFLLGTQMHQRFRLLSRFTGLA